MTGKRSLGGVVITEISRSPISDIFKVRGIGVADSVRTSTFGVNFLIFSLASTPKRCSSSRINKPRWWKFDVVNESSLCVPIIISTLPSRKSSKVCACCLGVMKRL